MRKPILFGAIAAVLGVVLATVVLVSAGGGDKDDARAQAAPTSTPAATSTPVAATSTPEVGASPTVVPPQATATVAPPATPTVGVPRPPTPTPEGSSPPPVPPDLRAVPAPIDGLDVRVLESFPPQYMLNVKAGLPSGCARRYRHEVTRSGDSFKVTVLNTIPAGAVPCTAIYGMYEVNINLPGAFVSGRTYTVQVNDKATTFRAQ